LKLLIQRQKPNLSNTGHNPITDGYVSFTVFPEGITIESKEIPSGNILKLTQPTVKASGNTVMLTKPKVIGILGGPDRS
jgi:hypothetical protein